MDAGEIKKNKMQEFQQELDKIQHNTNSSLDGLVSKYFTDKSGISILTRPQNGWIGFAIDLGKLNFWD